MGKISKQEKTEIHKIFVQKCQKEVFPFLRAYEVLRKKIKIKVKCIFCISLLIFSFFASVIFWMIKQSRMYFNFLTEYIFIVLPLLALVVYFCCKYKKNQNVLFALELKSKYMQKLLDCFGEIKWKNNENLITTGDLEKSELFPLMGIIKNNDEFCGKHKDIGFKICETTLFQRGKGGSCSEYKLFSGIILKFNLSKNFKAHTIVLPKTDAILREDKFWWIVAFLIGFTLVMINLDEWVSEVVLIAIIVYNVNIYYLRTKFLNKPDKQKIILEDVKFGQKYYVYSQDEVEARYIVTPAFMEKFLNLRTAFGAKNAKCAFYDNTVMFAISTNKNLFEIGNLDKTLLELDTFETLYNEINAIYEIIDYFNLDRK